MSLKQVLETIKQSAYTNELSKIAQDDGYDFSQIDTTVYQDMSKRNLYTNRDYKKFGMKASDTNKVYKSLDKQVPKQTGSGMLAGR